MQLIFDSTLAKKFSKFCKLAKKMDDKSEKLLQDFCKFMKNRNINFDSTYMAFTALGPPD